ncbi:MAG: hypothetical protein JEZ14_07550 [Marinilabiliaceae bacterium]|nr:hypothetical protein [Marinilabiliaceae bacterium]
MKSELRYFQIEAIKKVVPLIEKQKRILLQFPHGVGGNHTVLQILKEYYASITNIYKGKTLLVVATKLQEIQIKNEIKRVFNPSIINLFGEDKVRDSSSLGDERSDSIITVLTIGRLLAKSDVLKEFKSDTFKLIVLFECEFLGVGKENSQTQGILEHFTTATIMGIDAFPDKSRSFFGGLVYRYSLQKAIEDKYLLPYEYSRINTLSDIDTPSLGVDSISSTSINKSDAFYNNDSSLSILAKSIVNEINDQQTVIFCSNQEFATRLSEKLNSITNNEQYSKAIISSQSNRDNQHILSEFRRVRDIRVLTSVDLLTTGVDLPNVYNIILLRNFGSGLQLLSIINRFLRFFEDKTKLRVLDYFDNTKKLESAISFDGDIIAKNNSIKFKKTDVLFRDKEALNGVIGVKDIAEELCEIIKKMPYEQGRMIGIFGEWGRGKTFLMNQTWNCFQKDDKFARVDFHAWKYQETPAIWAYLYEQFASAYYKDPKDSWFKFWKSPLRRFKLNFARIGISKAIWFFVSVILSSLITFFIPPLDRVYFVYRIVSAIGFSTVVSSLVLYFKYNNSARELFEKYYGKTSFSNVLGVQAEVQKELKHLVKAWCKKDRKILLFVDDIDRCSEERIIQIIDSLRVMLDDNELARKLIVVAAIDERLLKRAIRHKYDTLVKSNDESTNIDLLVSEYIDKLFILGLKLHELTPENKDEFFLELTKEDRESAELEKLSENGGETEFEDTISNEEDQLTMEDSVSNEVKQINNTSNTNAEEEAGIRNLNGKLTKEEVAFLREKIRLLKNVTPRQIRVFYYRYLLAKNLLIRKYSNSNSKNIWLDEAYSSFMVQHLVNHSNGNGDHDISKLIEQLEEHQDEYYAVEEATALKVKTEDYKVALHVLDTVIGY